MGDQQEVARAARISYGNHASRTLDQDMRLTQYLYEHEHTSPFEMIELKWRVKAPIFVARQWLRHRTANVNEFSMRYAEPSKLSEQDVIEYYIPAEWRAQDPKNHQASHGLVDNQDLNHRLYTLAAAEAVERYHELVYNGVSREMARMILPVSVYTEFVWKNDLHNTLRFLKLRTPDNAQEEIRQYAKAMVELLKQQFPELMQVVWEHD